MNPSRAFRLLICVLSVLWLTAIGHATEPMTKLTPCTLVPTPWADGDSFLVKTATGEEHTIRLYGVDCIEWHVSRETDARRLRAQRRYFGITEIEPTAIGSIEAAKGFGKEAGEKTAALLAKPFTVHTRFRDAGGDSHYKRIYGFVTLADGRDLSATLVQTGLARAFGVDAETPDGKSPADSAAMLADLELQAAKRGVGVWARTDWDKLPHERLLQRQDDDEANLALRKQPLTDDFKLDPNTATRDDLMKLPGIREAMANRIIEHRPYQKPSDLLDVPGIGPSHFKKIALHLALPENGK